MKRPIPTPPERAAAKEAARRPPKPSSSGILFTEGFDDPNLSRRGWYDTGKIALSDRDPYSGRACIEYRWNAGGTTPATSAGMRRVFAPTEVVYLRCHIRLSRDWGWSGRPYHPHLMHFMTTENGPYHGPAASHLTLYIEPWDGRLRLAAQDIQNKDAPHGLTQGPLLGGYNGRFYDSRERVFTDDRWHRVEALFRLNSVEVKAGRANADGVVQGWVDGRQVVARSDVVLRSADFPRMRLNQFLLTPYFGPGLLPHAQTLWIDALTVGTKRLDPAARG